MNTQNRIPSEAQLILKPRMRLVSFLLIGLMATRLAMAGSPVWTGTNGPADLTWPTASNWFPAGEPGAGDDALFFDAGATNDNVSVSSIVTASRTIQSLRFGQTNAGEYHNLLINAGVTLTVAGTNDNGYGQLGINPAAGSISNGLSTIFSGPWPTAPAASTVGVTNTISGPGSLVANNTNNEMMIRYACSVNASHYACIDMTGLANFTANLARIGIGYGQPGGTVRAMGRLLLAKTNNITLTGTNLADTVQLIVGDNSGNNDGNSTTAFLHLGQVNHINVDRVLIGGQKTPGQVLFNTAFTNPVVVMRASDGVGRVTALRIGDESDTGASGNGTVGTVNLLSGSSDLLVDTLVIGKGQNGSGNTTAATGTLLMGLGTLNVNSMILGAQSNSAQGGVITGTANFSNSVVTVNSALTLGLSEGSPASRVANLNIFGGSMTVNGTYKNQGTVTINVTNSTLTMPAGSSITAKAIQLDGGALANAGVLKVTNTLTILDGGAITGNPILDLGNITGAPATWTIDGITNGALTVNNALQGAGTINGNVILAASATLSPGDIGSAGTLSIVNDTGTNGNLTLNNGGTLNFDLSATGGTGISANDAINVGSTLTVNGTINVFLKSSGGALDTTTPYTLITSGTLVGSAANFKVVGPLVTGRYNFAFDTTSVPNAVLLVVTGTGPANQTWVGDGTANNWDAQTTFNWNNGTSSSQFFNLDNVTFNDTGSASPPVNLVGSLVSGSMTVSNTAKSYTLTGAGALAVAGPFTKTGANSVTITNTGDNSFSSPVTVSGGSATFANNGQNTFLAGVGITSGSVTLAGNSTNTIVDPGTGAPAITVGVGTTLSVANANANTFNGTGLQLDGTLAFNQPVNATFDAVLTDGGTFTKNGNGTLAVAGANGSYFGPVQINGGTIVAANTASALGTGSIAIANGGALDVKGVNLGAIPIVVIGSGPTGAGALVNNGGAQNTTITSTGNALQSVTLTGNTTMGGAGQWNTDPIRNNSYFIIAGTLSTSSSNFNLTKVGLNQISIFNTTVDAALGNIDIQGGMLNFQGTTTSMGNPAGTLTVRAGGTLALYDTAPTVWTKNFVLFGDGATPNIFNYDGSHTIAGLVTLNGNCVIAGPPAGRGNPVLLTFNNPIGGTGSFNTLPPGVAATGTIDLAATNTYTGATAIQGGALLVDGQIGTNTVTVSGGGVLGGLGSILGPVTVSSDGTLSPGDTNSTPLGTLSIENTLTFGAGSTNEMDLNSSGGVLTSDLITNIATLNLGGTLVLNLNGDPLVAGNAFKLYSFSHANGAFAAIVPSTPGTGLQWDTSQLKINGTLAVATASAVNGTPTNITAVLSGNQLTLNWPSDHTGWTLQSQTTTLGAGLGTNWVDVPGSATQDSVTVTINTSGVTFYRMVLEQ